MASICVSVSERWQKAGEIWLKQNVHETQAQITERWELSLVVIGKVIYCIKSVSGEWRVANTVYGQGKIFGNKGNFSHWSIWQINQILE